ncbi:DUF1835 domain-containing protein [Aquimarina brevivitae]|uniref:DUF1835 domain-containing protein n=1 Tax=Aquimarina brevivitae TaxID=323412 RepID=A0A4Q7NUX6_9FLAO|nr:DUF1835 domain-containing protein [Aquimarina brevivitae]RZS90658.1 hypothetical protein EV197_3187 [Aquimarina brevivitae]
MGHHTLHILNGDSLKANLEAFNFVEGQTKIWREILCEGPTHTVLESEASLQKRANFLQRYYRISKDDYRQKFSSELHSYKPNSQYDEIILWFEYDLFCHINMIAAISFLLRNNIQAPKFSLVCSGRVKNEVLGLSELNKTQLRQHFINRTELSTDDLEFADYLWTIYCESDPQRFVGQIKKNTSFEYMSICLRAHLQRFPNMLTGLNVLEHNILKMIQQHQILNTKQLLGYALEYQGYYGYGDMQMKRVIARLFQFLNQTKERLLLSERGKLAVAEKKNFYNTQKLEWYYGGVKKYDYLYDYESHKLLKL